MAYDVSLSKRTAVTPAWRSLAQQFLGSAMLAREESAWHNANYNSRVICDALRNQNIRVHAC